MNEYELQVWFYFTSHGELEKESEYHTIEADSLDEAVEKAKKLYKSVRSIYYGDKKVY